MNVAEFTSLLARPSGIRPQHLDGLDALVRDFPYFQSARALQLKALYDQGSYRYNQALKTTAAATHDRSVLFDFITSGQFVSLQEAFDQDRLARIAEIQVVDMELVEVTISAPVNKLDDSIRHSIRQSGQEGGDRERASRQLEIGKPLSFSSGERHSFSEWLQLTSVRPIEREEEQEKEVVPVARQRKIDLIDAFIENNPKIVPDREKSVPAPDLEARAADASTLMTETLARVYLEQRKYQKAIQAYEILILKYPEKSSLFADRISDIRILQQNNN